MEFLYEYGLFAAKFATVSVVLIVLLLVISSIKSIAKDEKSKDKVTFVDLINEAKERKEKIDAALLDFDVSLSAKEKDKKVKANSKEKDKQESALKEEKKQRIADLRKEGKFCPKRVFVIEFDGDPKASDTEEFVKKLNYVLSAATAEDEVIIKLTSPGGVVNGYGLLSSQLEGVIAKNIHLTVCVDEVAASGGYLMACIADKIVAAPFSYIGSIGVVASLPNFNKVLKKYDVDYEMVTAGEYKRTLTMFGENTEEGREKFKEDLLKIHTRFKEIVKRYRQSIDIDKVSTGEFWLASDAKELNLIDEINTFDGYLQNCLEITELCAIKIKIEKVEKKGIAQIVKKFFKAESWTKAVSDELKNSSVNEQYHI